VTRPSDSGSCGRGDLERHGHSLRPQEMTRPSDPGSRPRPPGVRTLAYSRRAQEAAWPRPSPKKIRGQRPPSTPPPQAWAGSPEGPWDRGRRPVPRCEQRGLPGPRPLGGRSASVEAAPRPAATLQSPGRSLGRRRASRRTVQLPTLRWGPAGPVSTDKSRQHGLTLNSS
jgi:hypothetical protein